MRTYVVWCPDLGQEQEDGATIPATDPADAAEGWAEWHDRSSAEYRIVSGREEIVIVRDVETGEQREWIVRGEAYFAARPQMDMPNTRKAYDAGFQAGRDARRANSTCIWQQDGEGSDLWQTTCHQAFTINDGDPSDNSMAYCCFCGRRLEESPWPEDEDEAGGGGCMKAQSAAEDGHQHTHEARRWCHGDSAWSEWQPCTAVQAASYAKDETFQVRTVLRAAGGEG